MTPIPESQEPEKDPFHADDARSIGTQHRRRLADNEPLRLSGADDTRFTRVGKPKGARERGNSLQAKVLLTRGGSGISGSNRKSESDWSQLSYAPSSTTVKP
jgi:hypothetical protein